LLQQLGAGTLFLCGGERDRHNAAYIIAALETKAEAVSILDEHLSVVASIAHHADVFIGNDSGLFNLVAAIEACPTIGLFGGSRTLTYLPKAIFITPPDGITPSMQTLTPPYVLERILEKRQIIESKRQQ
jgi:ADP-heptose:LPS heptosyltransferase